MGKLILVADDDPMMREFARDLLEGEGYTIIEAVDGRQAVELANQARPDLISMDILMPEMDGYAACSAIKANQDTRNIPVIMLTGIGFDLNKNLASELGADGYATKPFNLRELLDTIKQLL